MKLLVLDGNSILNRAFYGIKLLSTKDGRFTNGIYGFLNILFKLLDEQSPDGVAVAFDLPAPTFRHKKYDAYKAGRKGMPDELAQQLPELKEILRLMGYRTLECEGYEADDILGTLAAAAAKNGGQCVIATGDRDSLQLVSDRVTVLLAATKMGRPEVTVYDTAKIREVYGLTPAQLIEVKALMGDASDHIPGVAGVGEKTALSLIGAFGSLDGVYENLEDARIKPGVRQKLTADRENAYLSRELGTICTEAPVDTDFSAYRPAPMDRPALAAKLAGLELFKTIERLDLTAVTPPPAAVHVAPEQALQWVDAAADLPKEGTLDLLLLEAGWELPKGGQLALGVQEEPAGPQAVLVRGGAVTVAPLGDALDLVLTMRDGAAGGSEGIRTFAPVRTHDSKALYRALLERKEEDIPLAAFDSMLAGYLLNPSASGYPPERLAQEYGAPEISVQGAPEKFAAAAARGAQFSALCGVLEHRVAENGQEPLLHDIELPLALVLADMEREGFLVDTDSIRAYGAELDRQITAIMREIYELVGYEFNLNSPKQLGEALFVKLGLPAGKKTKTGYSTNVDVLEKLRDRHPAVALLLEYRQLAKLKSTYCDGLLKVAGPDGRIHSTFQQAETRTGRISSTEPNLQNIPVRSEIGRNLRRFFVAGPGRTLCDADYSQIELRVLAHVSGDPAMIDAFRHDADIHTLTASQVFGVPPEAVTPLMRTRAKAVNFGIVYGIGAFSLAQDIGVGFAEAKHYIESYLNTYSGVKRYMDGAVADAKERGYAETLFGRRRYLPELASSNANLRAFGERVAMNMPIQGTAADIIKIAMVRVWRRLRAEGLDARLILQVHDELIVEAADGCAEQAARIVSEEMQAAAELSVPLPADVHTGRTWFDAKE